MAGSFQHVIYHDLHDPSYRGIDLLENLGDAYEAVEHRAFMLLYLHYNRAAGAQPTLVEADEHYFQCARGEEPWPAWFAREVN
jgi:hypothetical protein